MRCTRLTYQKNEALLKVVQSKTPFFLSAGEDKKPYRTKKRINLYPFGLKHGKYNTAKKNLKMAETLLGSVSIKEIKGVPTIENDYKYSFNSTEWQDEFDLNMYDLGARGHDPARIPFGSIDPRAEDYYSQSPYAFAANNPVYYVDINGEGVEDDYKYAANGDITLVKKTTDSTDKLIAENGDVISDNISKGILKDNINIKKDGLTIEGNVSLNARVGDLMTKISVYEQTEISWGFYSINDADNGVVNILPYEGNNIDTADAPSSNLSYNNKSYSLDFMNHTHPGLWNKTISGKWIKDSRGNSNPSSQDRSFASRSRYGGFVWGLFGVTHYNSKGVINKESYSKGLIRNYRDNNTVINRNYLKKTLKWKKDFSKPPSN